MSVIELLYPGAGNLYGESGNARYLRSRLPGAEFVDDVMGEEPWFVSHRPDLILCGSMTEADQETACRLLTPYKERLFSLIDEGVPVLATGNAWELFTLEIHLVNDDRRIAGLGLVPLKTETDFFARNHGKVLGSFEGMKIVGYHARFSQVLGDESGLTPFVKVEKGEGMNKKSRIDGVRVKNFFGTHLIGPLLPTNPDFCEALLQLAGIRESAPEKLLETAREAFRRRLAEFEKPGMKY